MRSVAEAFRVLEEQAADDSPHTAEQAPDLSHLDLRHAHEHDVALLLLLAALCSRLWAAPPVGSVLLKIAERYEETSLLYTGRILPRAREMIELLDRGVDERSLDALVELAEHLSQGWPEYPSSVFPTVLARLADKLDMDADRELFSQVSFVLWRQGLEAASRNLPDRAGALFEESLKRYRKYLYFADAAWLHTDLVITHLMAGRARKAADVCEEQRLYVEELIAAHEVPEPEDPRPYAFHLGDVRSGGYSTFVESVTLHPKGLTQADRALLWRYVHASDFLIAACRYRSRRDFDAALDNFSHGWTTFQQSPYPRILRHLVDRYSGGPEEWNVHLSGDEHWYRMLRTYRVRSKPETLVGAAATLHERFGYAGMAAHAHLVLLDAAVLHASLHGRSAAVEWITRYLPELRRGLPTLLSSVVDYLQAQPGAEARRRLSRYVNLRSELLPPDLHFLGLDDEQPPVARLEVTLYGPLLSVEGVTVYEATPPALVDILSVLGRVFTRSQTAGEDAPLLSAAELAERTDRTVAACVQTVSRFRTACRTAFNRATDWDIPPDAVIQGRPGYRINPHSVLKFTEYRTPEPTIR